ncbi:MAG: ThuA domain-containing protein [Vicinamibacteraceae bacterium]
MNKIVRATAFVALAGAMMASSSRRMVAPMEVRGGGVGQAGKPAGAELVFERAPDALERVSWRTRTLVGNDRITRWSFGIAASTLRNLTFLEAVVRTDAAAVDFVEGSSDQMVSPQLQKQLNSGLTAEERALVRRGMGDEVQMLTYRADSLGADAGAHRKLFEFASAMGVRTIVAPLGPATLDALEQLTEEFDVEVALLEPTADQAIAIGGLSDRIGIAVDVGAWMARGVAPLERLAKIKNRISYIRLRDRSALGAGGRNVVLGKGVGKMTELFRELNNLNLRPLTLMLDATGVVNAPADILTAVQAFEDTVQPAYGAFFTELSRAVPPRRELIRSGENEELPPFYVQRETEAARRRIEHAIPREPYAKPKQPRKLLVIDACLAGMSHRTIPYGNLMLEMMGQITGAWETEFNNDLNNLKYPKVMKYDAIFLNSNVGELLPDPAVREGLARFVREGGGLGGMHGTPWASRNWDEFATIIGAKDAPHRIEQGVMNVYDPASPIMKSFRGKPLEFEEEYYRFRDDGPERFRWENARVLLTVQLDDPEIEPRPWDGYKRPDNIYPVTWIQSYGEGRVFYCSLGHVPEMYMTPEIVGHFLAGMQFLLGDLDADTTPNPAAHSH